MSANNNGGPAFPVHANHVVFNGQVVAVHEQGMSLRDWFAGQALCGLMATPNGPRLIEKAASAAYVAADAMLRAREGGAQ